MTAKKDALTQEAQKGKSMIDDITQTPEEKKKAAEMRATMTTQGNRNGVKLARISLAFSDPNYHYVRVMSALRGKTMTRYINDLIAADREKNDKVYQKALKLAEEMKEAIE